MNSYSIFEITPCGPLEYIFTHGFVKKEQKTPKKEFDRAKSIQKLCNTLVL
ncbi:MAG: type II toxin-antitoxin system RelE/ParE family toxin [Candidatus Kuenenia stuttgartiensis]|nr:type II toxin-antitoxin system RelE/ParE family toxin [Candidatus Kuenenia stuttgartiensis]